MENKYLLLAECEVRTASYGPTFFFLSWPKREAKKQGSITCRTDRANEANKMFIIWLCCLFRFWKGDRELEVRTATYGPGIGKSQHAKSLSHIIIAITGALHRGKRTINTFHVMYSTDLRWTSCLYEIWQRTSWTHKNILSLYINSHCHISFKLLLHLESLLYSAHVDITLLTVCDRR